MPKVIIKSDATDKEEEKLEKKPENKEEGSNIDDEEAVLTEDIIDGFAILSCKSYKQIQAEADKRQKAYDAAKRKARLLSKSERSHSRAGSAHLPVARRSKPTSCANNAPVTISNESDEDVSSSERSTPMARVKREPKGPPPPLTPLASSDPNVVTPSIVKPITLAIKKEPEDSHDFMKDGPPTITPASTEPCPQLISPNNEPPHLEPNKLTPTKPRVERLNGAEKPKPDRKTLSPVRDFVTHDNERRIEQEYHRRFMEQRSSRDGTPVHRSAHEHYHMHKHMHYGPYGPFPPLFSPMLPGFQSAFPQMDQPSPPMPQLASPTPIPATPTGAPTVKSGGRWNNLHVRVAWFIYKEQLKRQRPDAREPTARPDRGPIANPFGHAATSNFASPFHRPSLPGSSDPIRREDRDRDLLLRGRPKSPLVTVRPRSPLTSRAYDKSESGAFSSFRTPLTDTLGLHRAQQEAARMQLPSFTPPAHSLLGLPSSSRDSLRPPELWPPHMDIANDPYLSLNQSAAVDIHRRLQLQEAQRELLSRRESLTPFGFGGLPLTPDYRRDLAAAAARTGPPPLLNPYVAHRSKPLPFPSLGR